MERDRHSTMGTFISIKKLGKYSIPSIVNYQISDLKNVSDKKSTLMLSSTNDMQQENHQIQSPFYLRNLNFINLMLKRIKILEEKSTVKWQRALSFAPTFEKDCPYTEQLQKLKNIKNVIKKYKPRAVTR